MSSLRRCLLQWEVVKLIHKAIHTGHTMYVTIRPVTAKVVKKSQTTAKNSTFFDLFTNFA